MLLQVWATTSSLAPYVFYSKKEKEKKKKRYEVVLNSSKRHNTGRWRGLVSTTHSKAHPKLELLMGRREDGGSDGWRTRQATFQSHK